jgi:hypothetical protein
MHSIFPSLRLLAVAALCAAAPRAGAQLAATSPFLPPKSVQMSTAAPEPLEFVGYRGTAEGLSFRVRDTTQNAGVWLKLNERSPDLNLAVKTYDPVAETLTVDRGGRMIVLPQRQAKIVAGAALRPVITPAVAPAVVPRAAAPGSSPSIDELAAALAQRRAARQQAASPAPAAPAPSQAAAKR